MSHDAVASAASGRPRRPSRKLWAHLALATVGLVAVLWALTIAAHPTITCRGAEMRPGDVCAKADQPDRKQTYEERFEAAQQSRPVVGVAGAVIAGFGGWLAFAETRKAQRAPTQERRVARQGCRDIGP